MIIATLENWCVMMSGSNYDPPELWVQRICGNVYGHPDFKDGECVALADPTAVDPIARTVTTPTAQYTLGLVDPQYEAAYPDADNRFWKSWSEGLAKRAAETGGRPC